MENNDTLEISEAHPASYRAMKYIKSLLLTGDAQRLLESFASCSMSDNRLAQVCYGTLKRIINNEPVSDRYLLGLAWIIREIMDHNGSKEMH